MTEPNHPSLRPTADELRARLAEIVALCQRYCSPAVNPGAFVLAKKVLELAGVKEVV